MKKYDINNFYVGKLTFLERFGNLLLLKDEYSKENSIKESERLETILRGAIDLSRISYFSGYTDYNIRCFYKSVYTIFYKENDKYYCLHNGNYYDNQLIDRNDFCDDLVSFKETLPKYAYNMRNELSLREARHLFNLIFKKNSIIYNNEKFNIDNFYFGTFDLCDEITQERRTFLCNLDRYFKIRNNGLSTQSGYGMREELSNDFEKEYSYITFYSAFYKLNENKFYNIHDFNIYDKDILDKYPSYKIEIRKPFKEKLQERNIDYKDKDITMPKVLKLTKKII